MSVGKHIILVGFSGSGKTSSGKALAERLNLPFIDVDEYISAKTGKTISEIFAEKGERGFRNIERVCLDEILIGEPRSVIATGGGTPCFDNNMDLMNRFGITVYLKAAPEILCRRLENDAKRPLIAGKTGKELEEFIENTLSERKVYYEKSQIAVTIKHAAQLSADELIKQLEGV